MVSPIGVPSKSRIIKEVGVKFEIITALFHGGYKKYYVVVDEKCILIDGILDPNGFSLYSREKNGERCTPKYFKYDFEAKRAVDKFLKDEKESVRRRGIAKETSETYTPSKNY